MLRRGAMRYVKPSVVLCRSCLRPMGTMLDKHGEETTPPAWYPGPGYIYDGDRWHPVPGYSRSGDYDAWPVGRSGSLLSIESAHQRLAILQPIGDPALPLDF
jgi:hypothetical protein